MMKSSLFGLILRGTILGLACFAIAACGGGDEEVQGAVAPLSIQLTSPTFTEGDAIPARYTCVENDVSPALNWSGAPSGTQSYAIIVEDPDFEPPFVHWVLYAIPPDVAELPEGIPQTKVTTAGAKHGINDLDKVAYSGPCRAYRKERPHRYVITLYALDIGLDLEPGADKKELLRAMKGHILANGQLVGKDRSDQDTIMRR